MADLPPLPAGAVPTTALQTGAPQKNVVTSAPQMPPLPPGAVTTSQASPPPLPPGAVPVSRETPSPAGSGIMSRIGEITGVAPLYREYKKQAAEGFERIKGDFTAPVTNPEGGKPGLLDYGARAGIAALNIAAEPFIPLSAAATSILGRPVEALGGPEARTTGDLVTMVAPFGKEVKAIGRLAKAKAVDPTIDGAQAVGKMVEKVFSPTTVSPKATDTEAVIRRATGQMGITNERAAHKLMQHNGLVANLPVPEQRALVDYIENRSKLPKGAQAATPELTAAADDIAKVYSTWRETIEKTLQPNQIPDFVTDYYAHLWKEKPSVVRDALGSASKQGSGRSFKKRTIPTISDGIKAGLTPKFENPIESTMAYSQNMAKYVATNDMLNQMKSMGYAKWFTPGSKNVPEGWVPLDGIMTKKNAPGTRAVPAGSNTGEVVRVPDRPIQLYAPADAARVFNNFISKGFEAGDAAPFYKGARAVANGMVQLKLGLSTFHLGTMVNETMIHDYARMFRALSKGEGKNAIRAFATAPIAPVKTYRRGKQMEREMLDIDMPDSMSKVVNDAFVRSGGQMRMDPFYRTRGAGSFYNSLEKGTFRKDLKETADKLYKGTIWENAKGAADLTANVLQTTAAPLFEKYIPNIKRGAFASEMEDFLRANPKATQAEIDKEAILIADSVDNRFGEMVQDNLFWNKKLKQLSQLALLSVTWNLGGPIREMGGGIKDLLMQAPKAVQGGGVSRRSAYLAGLAFQTALASAIYQYLKTGKPPEDVKDLMAGRTGGVDAVSGQPERFLTPGFQKDAFAVGYDFPHHVLETASHKLNPGLTFPMQVIANKDYRGLPIFPPHGSGMPLNDGGKLMDFLIETFSPISINQLSTGAMVGSNITMPERFLSIRPAPAYIQDTERVQAMQKRMGTQEWRRKLRADTRRESRLGSE